MVNRPWWATWWAVAVWLVASIFAVLPAVVGWGLWAWFPVETISGTDISADIKTPAAWSRVLAAIAAGLAIALPFLTARWARKIWLGYLLLAGIINVIVLGIGLSMFGIL